MQVLVSDSSVLIEFSKRDLLDRMFELRFQFAVPDLLFNEELIDLRRYDRQGPGQTWPSRRSPGP